MTKSRLPHKNWHHTLQVIHGYSLACGTIWIFVGFMVAVGWKLIRHREVRGSGPDFCAWVTWWTSTKSCHYNNFTCTKCGSFWRQNFFFLPSLQNQFQLYWLVAVQEKYLKASVIMQRLSYPRKSLGIQYSYHSKRVLNNHQNDDLLFCRRWNVYFWGCWHLVASHCM